MIQQGKNLKDMTVVELKARVWDLSALRNQLEIEIRETNDFIAQKSRPEPIPEVVKE